ncbi:MAG TPA: ISAzo13 family transposase [Terriglobales bacterium]
MGADPSVSEAERRWLRVLSTLNELQARLFVAQRALELGRGGISQVSRLSGMSRPAIYRGIAELRSNREWKLSAEPNRIRRAGGGRKPLTVVAPAIPRLLQRIVEENTAGDPRSLLKWTGKSTRAMAAELSRQGHPVSAMTVCRCLWAMEYSLQGDVKSLEGKQHPDRDKQFRYINRQGKWFQQSGDPVISVDTKKKELIGAFRNPGRSWRQPGQAPRVLTHDFPSLAQGKAVPYGTYDVVEDQALVNVGITHDTAEFAVASIQRWWRMLGKKSYPKAKRLLICADAGGSNGNRSRGWKLHLQEFADTIKIPITVCHYSPGTSKWNKIEHRLFSFISMNWRGQPLVSYEAVVNLIGSTRTRSGLKVKAMLDTRTYEKGQKVSSQQLQELNLHGHSFHPDWNYTISPRMTAS